jgi:hypothetical protein
MCIRVLVNRQADLAHVVDALGAPGRGSGGLDCRQQQGHEGADDGNHHQQFH